MVIRATGRPDLIHSTKLTGLLYLFSRILVATMFAVLPMGVRVAA
jgi:hypothetical protein